MAKSQIEIDLKSTYDGEGFKKLDNDLKSAGQQTKRASEGLNKIATTLGSVDNAGVKAVGTISNLLGTLASFGLKGLVFGAIAAGIQKVINHFREMEERVKSVGQSMRTYLSTAFLDGTRQADGLLKKLKDVDLAQKQKTEVKNINREAEYKVRQSQINLKYDKQKSNAKTETDRTEIELGRRRELLEARKEYEGTKARDNAEDIGNRMTQNEDKIKTLEDEKRKLQERLKPATQAEQAAQEIRNEQVALGKKIDVALERDNLARGRVNQSSVAEYMTADEKKEIYDSRVKNPLEALWDAVKFWENEKQFENGVMVGKKVVQKKDEYGNDVTQVVKDQVSNQNTGIGNAGDFGNSRVIHDTNVGLNGTPIAARLGKKLLDKTTESQWLKFEEQRRRAYRAFQSTWSKNGGSFVEARVDVGSKAYTDTMLEWAKSGRTDYMGEDFLSRYRDLGGTAGKTYGGARSGHNLNDVIKGFVNDRQFRKELQQLGKQSRKYFKIDMILDDAVRGLTFGRMTDRKVVETQQVLDGFNSVANPTNKQLHNLETLPAKGKRLVEKVADSKPAQAIGKAIKSPVGRVVTKVGGKALAAVNVADTAIQSTKVGYESEKWIEQLSQESNTDELLKKYQDNEERIKRLENSYKNNAEVDNLKKRLEKINSELKAAVEKKKTFGVEQTKIEAERKVTQAEISRDEYNLMTEEDKQDALTPVKQGVGNNLRIDKASMDRYMQSTPQSDAEEIDDQRIRLAEGLDKINNAEYEFNQKIEQGDKEQKKSNLKQEQKTLEQKYLENLKKQLDTNLKSVLEISPAEYSKLDLDKINSAIDIEAIKAANDTVITAMQNAAKAWQAKANQIGQLNMPEYQQGQRDAGNQAGKEADKRIKNIANAAGNRAALANRIFDNDGNIRKSATPTDIENFNNTTDYMDKAMGQDMTDEQRDKTKKIKDNLARLVLDKNGNIKKSANMANVRQYLAAKGMLENEGKAKKAAEAAQREKERMEQENNQNLRMIKDKLDNLGM